MIPSELGASDAYWLGRLYGLRHKMEHGNSLTSYDREMLREHVLGVDSIPDLPDAQLLEQSLTHFKVCVIARRLKK